MINRYRKSEFVSLNTIIENEGCTEILFQFYKSTPFCKVQNILRSAKTDSPCPT